MTNEYVFMSNPQKMYSLKKLNKTREVNNISIEFMRVESKNIYR
jgi:hypothetical protein